MQMEVRKGNSAGSSPHIARRSDSSRIGGALILRRPCYAFSGANVLYLSDYYDIIQ